MFTVFVTPDPFRSARIMDLPEASYFQWMKEKLSVSNGNLRIIDPITDPLPNAKELSAIIIGGSNLAVYDGYPWQRRLELWVREMVTKDIPFLGICYGHQTLVKAFGGTVELDPRGREFGVTNLTLNEAGNMHPLFEDLPSALTLHTAHRDIATRLPADFVLLATNKEHPIQAVARGATAIGIQVHPEHSTAYMLRLLNLRSSLFLQEGFVENEEGLDFLAEKIREASEMITAMGRRILKNFHKLAQQYTANEHPSI